MERRQGPSMTKQVTLRTEGAAGHGDRFASAVSILSMAHHHNPVRKHLVLNGIDNPLSAPTETVSFLPGRFFMTRRLRVFRGRLYAPLIFRRSVFGISVVKKIKHFCCTTKEIDRRG